MTRTEHRPRLAILISGRGRNLGALAQAAADGRIPAEIVAVVGNRADAEGLAYARKRGLPTTVVAHAGFAERRSFDDALADVLRRARPDVVALAGFMRVLGAEFVDEFRGKLVNIHPSLLPKYPGLKTHRRVLDSGDREHGATVHFVTPDLDGGPMVLRGRITVRPQDDEQQLAERVMSQVELKIYPQVVAWMARGELKLEAGVPLFRGLPLEFPLELEDLETEFR